MKKDYAELKAKLIAEKKTLLKEIKPTGEIDFSGDEVDAIQAKILLETNKHLALRSHNKIMQIDDALKKIEKETYGLCEDCEEEISQKRLDFNPYFLTCVSCEEEREKEATLKNS